MFVLANFIDAIASILSSVLQIYSWIVLISVLLSWVRADPYNPIVQFIRAMTEPVFSWLRQHVPFAMIGMLDLSPILVFLGLRFMQIFLIQSLHQLAYTLR